jgi:hypothetical protein
MSSAQREYDPEIKDIADYVANKTIDSELAVSISNLNLNFQFQSRSAEASILHPAIPRLEASPASTPEELSRETQLAFNCDNPLLIHNSTVRHCSMDPPRHSRLRS